MARAIVGFSDGRMVHHRIAKFSPDLPVVHVHDEVLLPVEQLAFIAFLKEPNDPRESEIAADIAALTMRINRRSYQFQVRPTVVGGEGFFAVPDGPSPFRELYFFHHAEH